MSQTLSDVVLHIVFSTKDRIPLIDSAIEPELYKYICGILNDLKCPVIQINGNEDHIHILLRLSPRISQGELVSKVKSNSSRWIKTKNTKYKEFAWQKGYGAFSVSRSSINSVIRYIANQKERHNKLSFKEEFLGMLRKAKIHYDENLLWD